MKISIQFLLLVSLAGIYTLEAYKNATEALKNLRPRIIAANLNDNTAQQNLAAEVIETFNGFFPKGGTEERDSVALIKDYIRKYKASPFEGVVMRGRVPELGDQEAKLQAELDKLRREMKKIKDECEQKLAKQKKAFDAEKARLISQYAELEVKNEQLGIDMSTCRILEDELQECRGIVRITAEKTLPSKSKEEIDSLKKETAANVDSELWDIQQKTPERLQMKVQMLPEQWGEDFLKELVEYQEGLKRRLNKVIEKDKARIKALQQKSAKPTGNIRELQREANKIHKDLETSSEYKKMQFGKDNLTAQQLLDGIKQYLELSKETQGVPVSTSAANILVDSKRSEMMLSELGEDSPAVKFLDAMRKEIALYEDIELTKMTAKSRDEMIKKAENNLILLQKKMSDINNRQQMVQQLIKE